jgi:hypothetical protein
MSRDHCAIRKLSWLPALALLVLAGCSGAVRDGALPPGAPSFVGRVVAVNLPNVLLVADTTQPAGADRASVRTHAGTHVVYADGRAATPGALRPGQSVRAWFDGPVMESYPVQATAAALVIDEEE